ncbi:MAG: type II toxin-antitoxin system Phd/YefM family antitoxin [Planctomycetota bacterium]
MIALHPSILERNGKKAFAVLPYEEFLRVREALDDYADLKVLRAAKASEAKSPSLLIASVRKKLKI